MKPSRLNNLPLRMRFLLWQLAVLVPLLLTALFGQFYIMPRLVEPLQEIAQELTEEVMVVKDLQVLILMTAMPVHDYLIRGQADEIELFEAYRQQIDQKFDQILATPFGHAEERPLVEAARAQWQQAAQIAQTLFRLADPTGDAQRGEWMERFDGHLTQAAQRLDEVYHRAHQEILEAQAESSGAQTRAVWLTALAFVLALAASLLIGQLLVRSILAGLTALHEGAARVAAGDFSRRIHPDGIGELETLAQSFNAMAEKVQAHKALLEALAVHDQLTGLENRRALATRLGEELQRARRYQRPLALLILDIDHFKAVNDNHGHPAGDTVLRHLAGVIEQTIRPADKAYRYGGEEFIILAPETDLDGALAEAQRLRRTVAATPFPIAPGRTIEVTISIGVAAFPSDAQDDKALVGAADSALYRAKHQGRNQVQAWRVDT